MNSFDKKPPQVPGLPLIGNVFEYLKSPLDFYFDIKKKYGDIARYKIAHLEEVVIFHPRDIKRVLSDNADNYDKSSAYRYLREVLGNGMLTADYNDWEWRRKLAAPAFTKQMLHDYGVQMVSIIDNYADRWSEKFVAGQEFSLYREMNQLALEIAGVTMFGSRLIRYSEALSEDLTGIMILLEKRITSLSLPLWIPTSLNRRYKKTLKSLHNTISKILDEGSRAFEAGEKPPVLIRMLIEQSRKKPAGWNMIDEAITYLVAGHETTGSALAWAFYLVLTHPEVQERLDGELNRVPGNRPVTMDDLNHLVYTEQVVRETLRLYPSIWTFGRRTINEDVLGGCRIEAGTDLAIVPFVTHRNPDYWPDSEKFDPDRFAPGKEIDKYQYFPFSAGPRNCIGHRFAMQEMVLVLATFMRRFRLKLREGFVAYPEFMVAMRPSGGMPVSILSENKFLSKIRAHGVV